MVDGVVDFRSDTVTTPTPAMLKAMTNANIGDDVYLEDPNCAQLEETVAGMFGKEAGLFVASGTMSNQLALRVHVGPLQSVLCDARSHIHLHETGGLHAHCGASVQPVEPHPDHFLTPTSVEHFMQRSHSLYHAPLTRLVALENTLNGTVMPLPEMKKVCDTSRQHGFRTHLDGARIWNALVAHSINPLHIGQHFDTVSVCLSKGLGCPVGSVLVGPRDLMETARHFRKMYGGGWRQAGFLAAAGLHALDNHVARLAEDHANAHTLANGLTDLGFEVTPAVETNMVFCNLPAAFDALPNPMQHFTRELAKDGVRISEGYSRGQRNLAGKEFGRLRLVTHLQTPAAAVARLLASARRVVRAL